MTCIYIIDEQRDYFACIPRTLILSSWHFEERAAVGRIKGTVGHVCIRLTTVAEPLKFARMPREVLYDLRYHDVDIDVVWTLPKREDRPAPDPVWVRTEGARPTRPQP